MDQINRRVPREVSANLCKIMTFTHVNQSMGVRRLDGEAAVLTKANLKSKLLTPLRSKALDDNPSRVREAMESNLMPWVMANSSAFPELLNEAFMFISILPVSRYCYLDCRCLTPEVFDLYPRHLV